MPPTFSESELVLEVLKRSAPALSKAAEASYRAEARGKRPKNFLAMNRRASDAYDVLVGKRVVGISSAIESSRDALRLMSLVPTKRALAKAELDRGRWVDYHYGAFIVLLASIPDICLVLTGCVLMLELTERQCTYDRVLKCDKVKASPLAEIIRDLHKSARPIVDRRHLHVHRGQHAALGDMNGDRFFTHLRTLNFLASFDDKGVDEAFLRRSWRMALSETLPVLQQHLAEVDLHAAALADTLLGPYRRISDALRAIDDIAAEL